MAPRDQPDGSDRNRDRDNDKRDPEQNPFVHFRRSVDAMAASVFSDLAEAFPSLQKHVPPPGTSFFDTWAREACNRFNDSYERATNPERKRIERCNRDGGDESHEVQPHRRWGRCGGRRRDVQETEKQTDPTADAVAAGILSILAPFEGLLFAQDDVQRAWRPTADYLTESEYSPCNLEKDRHLQAEGDRWRLAFEDLLRVEHSKQMVPLPNNWAPQPPSRASYVWMYSLAQKGLVEDRGTYPFLLQTFGLAALSPYQLTQARFRNPNLNANFRAAEQAFFDLPESPSEDQKAAARETARQLAQSTQGSADTELDLYEQWLRSAEEAAAAPMHTLMSALAMPDDQESAEHGYPGETRQDPSTSPPSSRPAYGDAAQYADGDHQHGLGILSSLTTTETRTLPDGSILTHTTLKKRFADGREQVDEETTVKPPDEQRQARASPARSQEAQQQTRRPTRQGRIADALREQQKPKVQKPEAQPQEPKKQSGGWFWSR